MERLTRTEPGAEAAQKIRHYLVMPQRQHRNPYRERATTPTLIDGEAVHSLDGLKELCPLTLTSCETLAHSFLHVRYDVMHRPTEE